MGVVGCGYWGPNHIRNLSADRRVEVKYACDLSLDRRQHMKSLYPEIDTIREYEKMLKDPEVQAVVIATPVATHYEIAFQALRTDKHVLVEKPMTMSSVGAKKLINLAKQKKRVLMVGHTFLYHKCVHEIKKILKKRQLGKLYYIHMQRLNLGLFQKDINVVWDLASHDLSILLFLMKKKPYSISVIGKVNIYGTIEDVAFLTLRYSDGLIVHMQLSWIDPHKVRKSVFIGSKKMLVYDDVDPVYKIKIYDKRVEKPKHYDTFNDFQFSYRYGDVKSPVIKVNEPLREECRDFVGSILKQGKPLSNGRLGLDVIHILESAQKSIKKNGRWTSIRY